MKDLMERSGVYSNNLHTLVEDICASLLEKKLEVKKYDENGKREYRGISPMDECGYREDDAYIEAKVNDSMKPFLLQVKKRFTMYEAGYFLPLGSKHSMRIYELLKMREDISILRITVEPIFDTLFPGTADFKELPASCT
ncbi:MAG: RepB family plasmid replication initiator protein [Salinibacter sp.]